MPGGRVQILWDRHHRGPVLDMVPELPFGGLGHRVQAQLFGKSFVCEPCVHRPVSGQSQDFTSANE